MHEMVASGEMERDHVINTTYDGLCGSIVFDRPLNIDVNGYIFQ
jgi:hypothetical protein